MYIATYRYSPETGSPGLTPEESGLQERGETSSHGLKYPAPEDSGVYI